MGKLDPLDEQEQQALIALFQAFLQASDAVDLRLQFYADTGGSVWKTSNTRDDERCILQWLDMAEGAAMMQSYIEEA